MDPVHLRTQPERARRIVGSTRLPRILCEWRGHHTLVLALTLLGVFAALLTACAPAASTSPTPTTPPATPTPTRTPTLLFTGDWSQGLAGWQATPGWSIVNGALQSDGGDGRSVTIPYHVAVSTYALEYTMAILQPRDNGEFDASAAPAPGSYGYQLRLYNMLSPGHVQFALHPQFGVTIDPIGTQNSPSPWVDFEPGTRPHRYRIEIRGPMATVYVDDKRISPIAESTDTPTLSGGPLTLTCSLAVVQVSDITISAL